MRGVVSEYKHTRYSRVVFKLEGVNEFELKVLTGLMDVNSI